METMKCEHDWVDGACGATAPAGTPGWEQRTGRNGDVFWLCPESVAEFPEATDGEYAYAGIIMRAGWRNPNHTDRSKGHPAAVVGGTEPATGCPG